MTGLKGRLYLRLLGMPLSLGVLVLWPAGTLDFWQVYVYFIVLLALTLTTAHYFLKHDPALLERRMRMRENEKTQQAIIPLLLVLVIAGFVIPGLDRRFGWSDIPVVVVLGADLLVAASYLFVFKVMKTNSYASRVVEVEEGQQLIRSGPYALVRHPMYSGIIVMYLATPVALGSWWGLVPFIIMPFLLIPRIFNEEKLLIAGLAGYREYCSEVRWRLLPYVW